MPWNKFKLTKGLIVPIWSLDHKLSVNWDTDWYDKTFCQVELYIWQGFPKGGDFSKLKAKNRKGAKGGAKIKIFGDELILDFLELQMKSKKRVLGVYISNLKTYTRYYGLRGWLPFQALKRGRFEKRVWETLI